MAVSVHYGRLTYNSLIYLKTLSQDKTQTARIAQLHWILATNLQNFTILTQVKKH